MKLQALYIFTSGVDNSYFFLVKPTMSINYSYSYISKFIYLFGVLCRFQHCTGHITTGSWKGRGNQYIEFARVLYCKLPTNGKKLPAFPHKALTGIEPRPQRWEARVLPLCHRGPSSISKVSPSILLNSIRIERDTVLLLSLCTFLHIHYI